ncbi:hypothetical protein HDU76_008690, partial [Blyttiomyces sp. JEL0837]
MADEIATYANTIWIQALESNWDNESDISLLPIQHLPTIKTGLDLVTSKSTYQRLYTLREDLADLTNIKNDFERSELYRIGSRHE